MKFYEGLEWAMGFQWPVIAVFVVLLVIGIERLINMMGAPEPSRDIASADIRKRKRGHANIARKLQRAERHVANRAKVGLRALRKMHQTPQSRANRG